MKVIASDLDGTLLDSNAKFSEDSRKLIKKIRSKGYLFGIATGRPYFRVKSVIPDVEELFDFLICNNGAEVYDFVADRHHQQFPLQKELIEEIIIEARELGANPILYGENCMFTERKDSYNQGIDDVSNVRYVDDVTELLEATHPKIIFSLTESLGAKIVEHFSNKKNTPYNVFKSQRELVEFMDSRVNKEIGLEWFCHYHDISLDEVMSFGDNDNDYELVNAAGIGVAMSNATDYVKSAADHIAKSNDENGVYQFLTDYLSI